MSETKSEESVKQNSKVEVKMMFEATFMVSENIFQNIDAAPELEHLILLLETAAMKHREKYPNTEIKCRPLAFPFKEITL